MVVSAPDPGATRTYTGTTSVCKVFCDEVQHLDIGAQAASFRGNFNFVNITSMNKQVIYLLQYVGMDAGTWYDGMDGTICEQHVCI